MKKYAREIGTLENHDFHTLLHETTEGQYIESFGELCHRISQSFNSSYKALEFLTYAEKHFQDNISWSNEHIGDEEQYSDKIYKLKVIRETMDFFEKLQAFDKTTHQLSKVKLNLSVEELACLISLLYDEGIIKEKDNPPKTVVMKTLSQVFSSKGKDSISANSLLKKFQSPSPPASVNIEILLRNLISRIKKSDKY